MKKEPKTDRQKYITAKHELTRVKAKLKNAEERLQEASFQAMSLEMMRRGLACNPEPVAQNLAKLLDAEIHNLRKVLGK